MTKISAVIITFNEENKIARCLSSIDTLCDEIIIIDSFSTDNTVNICQKFPKVKISQRAFTSHGDQKNFGNSLAKNEYILSLDADEFLSEELLSYLLKINIIADAYSFRRLNHLNNKPIRHGLWYPDEKIRLFKNGIATWECNVLHEELIFEKNNTICRRSEHILHFAFNNHLQLRNRTIHYAQWWAKFKHKAGHKSNYISAFLHAIWTFIRAFFIKLAFLDGMAGIYIAIDNTKGVYQKYKLLHILNNKNE